MLPPHIRASSLTKASPTAMSPAPVPCLDPGGPLPVPAAAFVIGERRVDGERHRRRTRVLGPRAQVGTERRSGRRPCTSIIAASRSRCANICGSPGRSRMSTRSGSKKATISISLEEVVELASAMLAECEDGEARCSHSTVNDPARPVPCHGRCASAPQVRRRVRGRQGRKTPSTAPCSRRPSPPTAAKAPIRALGAPAAVGRSRLLSPRSIPRSVDRVELERQNVIEKPRRAPARRQPRLPQSPQVQHCISSVSSATFMLREAPSPLSPHPTDMAEFWFFVSLLDFRKSEAMVPHPVTEWLSHAPQKPPPCLPPSALAPSPPQPQLGGSADGRQQLQFQQGQIEQLRRRRKSPSASSASRCSARASPRCRRPLAARSRPMEKAAARPSGSAMRAKVPIPGSSSNALRGFELAG